MVRRRRIRRGVTLVEALALIVVLGIAAPPLATLASQGLRRTADQQRQVQSVWLCAAVIEHLRADAASGEPGRDFVAMGDAAYLDDPITGLYQRLSHLRPATGGNFVVEIGAAEDASGAATDATDAAAVRLVTVRSSYRGERGTAETVVISIVGVAG